MIYYMVAETTSQSYVVHTEDSASLTPRASRIRLCESSEKNERPEPLLRLAAAGPVALARSVRPCGPDCELVKVR